ncbi:MAG: cytochrome c [Xanthomonadales bacterium]|nr:cytochrome c [Xanthomonadales bacterium]
MIDPRPRTSRPRAMITSAVVAVIAVAALGVAEAQQNRAAQQIKYRQAAYTILGTQFGIMGAMAQGRAPWDAKAFATAAERAAFIATVTPDTFPAGSESGAPTKAKPEIWRNEAEFGRMINDLQAKTAALATAAKGGNADAAKAALGAAGQTCKACHDKYKLD